MRDAMFLATGVLLLSGCYLFHRLGAEAAQIGEEPDASVRGEDASTAVDGSMDAALPRDPRCTTRRLRKGERFEPVDMVWVVDSSRSMADEQSRIQETMNKFVSDAEARHFDVRLVMVTNRNIVPPPLGTDSSRYRFVQREVGSEEPLQALIDEFSRFADFLRFEAALHFVIVSDDDSDLPAADFKRQVDERVLRPYTVHAVVSPDVGGEPCRSAQQTQQCESGNARTRAVCGAADIGRQYNALAEQTGGEEISICVDDWREVFGPLLEAVTPTAIPCSIELGSGPELPSTRVEIKHGESSQTLQQVAGPLGCEGQRGGYYFVDRELGPELTLCPEACSATTGDDAELLVSTYCD